MQIVDFAPIRDPGGPGARTVAMFAVEFPEMKLSGFRLRLRTNGSFIIAPPAAFGARVVNFAPHLFSQITAAAEAAYRRPHALDRARA